MNELTLIRKDGGAYIDSREAAEIIGKDHRHLLRDIRGYCEIIERFNAPNFGRVDFFLESSYFDAKGEERPCFLLSKMGCEMVAHKLNGEKGVLFTAAYVAMFNEMERRERAELEAAAAMRAPRLGEYNACARIIVRGLKWLGATPGEIMRFLKNTYEPLGIAIDIDAEPENEPVPQWYRAGEIAERVGMYSRSGKPHALAVACILNENIIISAENKRVVEEDYNGYFGVGVYYDDSALSAVIRWLIDNNWPSEVYGFSRTYHVRYSEE